MALTTVKSDQIQTSVALAGSPTTTTQSASDNSTKIATTAYADTAVANLVASAPASLNTLDELAAALNDDASFSTTITNSIAAKLPLAGGTLTGDSAITKETPIFTLTDSSASRTLQLIVDDNNSVVRASGPLLIQSGGASSAITLDASQNATFGGNVNAGAGLRLYTDGSNNAVLYALGQNKSMYFAGDDAGVGINALILDMANGGKATFANDIAVADNRGLRLGSNNDSVIYNDGSNLYIKNNTSNQDIIFQGNDDGSTGTTALTLDMSEAGKATFNAGGIFNDDVSVFGSDAKLYVGESGAGGTFGFLGWNDASNYLFLGNSYNSAFNTDIVISSAGKVGIGNVPTDGTLHVLTASAGTVTASTQADDLVVENNAETGITIISPDDQSARIRFTSPSTNNDVGGAHIFYRQNINKMNIGTNVSGGTMTILSGAGNETLILDSSGNALVGTTNTGANHASDGAYITPAGQLIGRATGIVSYLNRRGSDGQILQFMDDGTGVGSIDVSGGDLLIHSHAANHGGLRFGEGYIFPVDNSGATSDGVMDLGLSVGRYKDLYLSGGINFSDASGGQTYSAGNAANTLDDYEEGTWTPVISHNDGSGAVPLTVTEASYTKVGGLVYVRGYLTGINPNGNAAGSGAYYGIRGFPFGVTNYGVWNLAYATNSITSYGGYTSAASFYFLRSAGTGPHGQAHVSGSVFNAYGSNLVLMFDAVYRTND